MTNFMTDKHIIHNTTCSLPHGKGQHTGMNIKLSCLYFLVLNHQVLSSKQFGELRLDFVIDCHLICFVWKYYTKEPRCSGGVM